MSPILDRLKDWWQNADRTQKIVTVFGAAFLVLVLGLTISFASRPSLQPVIPGLSDQDKSMVYDELIKAGFPVQITPQGEVVVPSGDVARAKMVLASKNRLPKSSGQGLAIIDSLTFGDSQRKENEKIIAAKEKELAESIMTMNGVGAAQVHLTLGKDSPFGDQATPPTAAVRVTESNDGGLSSEQAKAIARLVQNAVTGLTASGVTVVTDAGRMVFDGQEADSTSTLATKKMEAEAGESRRRAAELQRELDTVFGKGNTLVQVDVQLNMDTTTINRDETIRTGDAVIEESASETLSSSGGDPQIPAGADANVPGQTAAPDQANPQGSDYNAEQKSRQFPTSNTKTQIQKAAGEIIAMNVNVTANSLAIQDAAPLEQRVEAYVAPWAGDPKFTTNVTLAEFSDAAAKAEAEAAAAAAAAARTQQIISLLPVAALVLVAVFLVKSLAKALKTPTQQMVLSNGQTVSVPVNLDPELAAILRDLPSPQGNTLPTLYIQDDQDEEEVEVEEETEETDEAGQPVVVKKKVKKKKRRFHDDEEEDEPDIESIKKRVDIPLEQIRKMSKKNPEAVAMLLKSWMMEEPRS